MTTQSDRVLELSVVRNGESVMDWRILHSILSNARLYVLEFRDPCMRQWHEMFRSETYSECEEAYDAYQEGEQPKENDWWP